MDMKKAGDLLASFLDERILKTARTYSELFTSWQNIAGEKIAAHSRIQDLEHSILLVEADHPGWIQILQTKEKYLLDSLRRRFPDQNITGISFRLNREPPDVSPPRVLSAIPTAADTGEQEVSIPVQASDTYEHIDDEHFKETLKRLEKSIILRNKR
jgi:hypothetical protein